MEQTKEQARALLLQQVAELATNHDLVELVQRKMLEGVPILATLWTATMCPRCQMFMEIRSNGIHDSRRWLQCLNQDCVLSCIQYALPKVSLEIYREE